MNSSFVFGRRSKTPNPPAAAAAADAAAPMEVEPPQSASAFGAVKEAFPGAPEELTELIIDEDDDDAEEMMPIPRPSAKSRLGAIIAARTLTVSDAAEAAQRTTRPRSVSVNVPSVLPAWQRLGKKIPAAYLEDLVPNAECGWMWSDNDSFDTAASIIGSDCVASEETDQRRKRLAGGNDSGVSSGSRASQPASKRQRTGDDEGLLLQCMEEYDIEQMEGRAERLSDMPAIRWRAGRFEEEVAPEFTMVVRAREMNERLERFREQEEYGEFD